MTKNTTYAKKKKLAAKVLNSSPYRIRFDQSRIDEISEAITRGDIRRLVGTGAITELPMRNTSRFHARYLKRQKAKGRRRGVGTRKGVASARMSPKTHWINTIRKQRALLLYLKNDKKIQRDVYNDAYAKAKGGFFRSARHLKLYLSEKGVKY